MEVKRNDLLVAASQGEVRWGVRRANAITKREPGR